MNQDLHQQAAGLIDRMHVEGISSAEQDWLADHLERCSACSERARLTKEAIGSIRAGGVQIDASLVNMAKARVRLRATELRQREERLRPLWLACVFSWLTVVLTTPYFWRAFEWIGQILRLPDLVWQTGFVVWWSLPAAAAAIVLGWWEWRTRLSNGRGEHSDLLEGR